MNYCKLFRRSSQKSRTHIKRSFKTQFILILRMVRHWILEKQLMQ